MDRRTFLARAGSWTGVVSWAGAALMVQAFGCRGNQFGHVVQGDQPDLVGSHAAGAEVYNPLIEEAVAKLLARQHEPIQTAGYPSQAGMGGPRRVCFIGVENKGIEELGDFKEQVYEQIDTMLVQADTFQPVSRRFVDAALRETRLRPDALMIPENMRTFAGVLERQGQPLDYLLFATWTTGTTVRNESEQRDYLLTLELVDVRTGAYDKQSAKIRKGYHKTRAGKFWHYNPLKSRS